MNRRPTVTSALLVFLVIAGVIWVLLSFLGSSSSVPGNSKDGGGTGAQSELPPTQTFSYVPGVPASTTPIESGSCWTNSIAAPFRPDAWRCSVGNSINDPCFELPGGKSLVCGVNPVAPDSSSTFVLQLTKPLPPVEALQGPVPADWAWLVQLSDGTLCSPFTGTLPIAAGGESASYGCAPKAPGEEGLLIFGDFAAGGTNGKTLMATVGTLAASTSGPPTIASSTEIPVAAIWQ